MAARVVRRTTEAVLRFWHGPGPPRIPAALGPFLSLSRRLYAAGLARSQQRALLRRRSLPAFVISVGNLTSGGTGKTPLTLRLAAWMRELGSRTAILSRGYGRCGGETVPAPQGGDAASHVLLFGDEPVLMARKLPDVPVWVGPDRWTSGMAAIGSSGARVLLLDDGFQHLALARNLDLVLLDAENPFGNGLLLPLGPLREPPEHLQRADAIVLTRAEDPHAAAATHSLLTRMFPGKPLFTCTHRLSALKAGLGGHEIALPFTVARPVVAFAGIARPDSFFRSLEAAGMTLVGRFPFPDHHRYAPRDIEMLLDGVRKTGACFLVTTEKDAVRLPASFLSWVVTAGVEVDFGEESRDFFEYIGSKLASHR